MKTVIFFLLIIPSWLLGISTQNQDTSQISSDEYLPWFTGPLIAGAGHTCPKGHYVLEPYLYLFTSSSTYQANWKTRKDGTQTALNPELVTVVGITNWMDIQIGAQVLANFKHGKSDLRVADSYLYLGFQALEDKRGSMIPDLRILIKQDFPTGHYEHLCQKNQGVDISGSGFYKTGIAFNFQKLFYPGRTLFRTRLNFNYKISPKTNVEGLSVFGGNHLTQGKISSVHFFTADFAFEYLLSQHIALACDVYYEHHTQATFKGDAGSLKPPGLPSAQRISLAPALEYNFSDEVGIIAGSWFSVAGKNAANFSSFVVALNYYH